MIGYVPFANYKDKNWYLSIKKARNRINLFIQQQLSMILMESYQGHAFGIWIVWLSESISNVKCSNTMFHYKGQNTKLASMPYKIMPLFWVSVCMCVLCVCLCVCVCVCVCHTCVYICTSSTYLFVTRATSALSSALSAACAQ